MMKTFSQNYGQAIDAMKQGKIVSREGWNGKELFVFMQVPSVVPAVFIPRMTSLPTSVKTEIARRGMDLKYANQFAIVNAQNEVSGWVASSSDTLATDWCIHDEYVEAGGTVGTAQPIISDSDSRCSDPNCPFPGCVETQKNRGGH